MHQYDAKDLERLFGLPERLVRSLARAGHIHPVEKDQRVNYSFQDLLILRMASALWASKISSHKINRAFNKIRESLPPGSGLNALSITPHGNAIAVREGQRLWESDSGQYALPLAMVTPPRGVQSLKEREDPSAVALAAREHFEHALSIEEEDPAGASAAYAACLELDAAHVEARINLGRLLHMRGELTAAERVYRAGSGEHPLLLFNQAVVLEDLGRETDAMAAYREALVLDPRLADAHFNLARLHERAQNPKDALRHLLAYRRLTNNTVDP